MRYSSIFRERLHLDTRTDPRLETWLRAACRGLTVSHLWLFDESGALWRHVSPGSPPPAPERAAELAERVMRARAPLFLDDVGEGSYAGVPLSDGNGVPVGSLVAVRSGAEWSGAAREALLELAEAVRMELHHTEEVAELRLESLASRVQRVGFREAVLITTHDGRFLSYNHRFAEMWGIPPEGPGTTDCNEALQGAGHLLEDPEAFLYRVEELYAHPEAEDRAEIPLADGRVLERYSAATTRLPMDARVWLYRDVTGERRAREALRASEERYRALFEQAPMGVFVFDRDLIFRECNDSLVESLQSTRQRLIGLDLTRLRDPHLLPAFRRVLEGESARYEGPYEATTSDARIWVEIHFSPLHDSTGEVVGGIGIVQDVTRRRAGQERLRQSEERFRQMAETMREVFWMVTPDLSKTLYVSPAYEEVWGESRESLYADPLSAARRIHPEDRERILSAFPRVERGETVTEEYRIRRPDGEVRWVVSHAAPVYDERGRVYRVAGITEDITERKQAEEALQRSEAYFRSLTDNLLDVIAVVDWEGVIRYASPSVERVLGYSPAELTGRSTFDLVHPDDREPMSRAFEAALRSPGTTQTVEYRVRDREGEWRRHEALGKTLDEDASRVVINARDVTERRQAEAELRASRTQLSLALQGARQGLWDWSVAAETLHLSPEWERMLGYEPGEVPNVYRSWEERIHPDDVERTLRRVREHLEGRSAVYEHEYRLRHRAGRWIWVLDRGQVVERDPEGRPLRMTGTITNVTRRKEAEERLRRSEERLSLALEGAKQAMWDWNIGTGEVVYDSRWERMLGFEPGENPLVYETWERLVHPDDLPRTFDTLNAYLRGETPVYESEYRMRTKGGEWKWILDRGEIFERSDDGAPLRMAGTHTDVTERKQAEAALEENEARLRLLVEQVPAILWTTDRELRFTSSEGAGLRALGTGPDQVVGMSIPEYRSRFGSADVAVDAHRRALAGEHVSYTDAFAGRSYRVHVEPLRDTKGGTIGTIGIALDVTAEQEAMEAQARLAAILSATPDFVALVEPDGTARYVNPAGRRMLGLAPDEPLSGFNLRACHPSHLQEALQAAIEKAIREGAWAGEDALLAEDGREIPVSQVIVAHRDAEGRVEFLSTIMRDISEQRQLEAQLRQAQKMEAVGRLAGGVAHDFNNLLTAIKGNTELLLLDLASESPMRGDLEEVRQAAERATNLTRQLLAFSRQQMLQPQVLDLNQVVSGTERLLRRVIGESVRLETRLDPALDRVRADPGQLEQVIVNLAVNARDAMPAGGTLTLQTRNGVLTPRDHARVPYIQPGRYVVLSVTDTGEGIPPEVRERIFEPFFTTKAKGKGTGLGLSTVYGIIKQSGGYVWVESAPGGGTRFDIYLPRVESEIGGEPAPEEDGALEEGCETVLIVEDEDAVRSLARRILERSGYTVRVAESGDAALRLATAHEEPIHLLLTDVVMPGMSGRELAERMRELRPETQVLYMSGYTEEEIGRHGLHGEPALVQKPFTPDELARRVRQALHPAGRER